MTAGTIPGHKTAPAKPINPKPAMITQSSPRRWGARAVKNIPKHTITRMSEQAISQIGRQVWTMLSDVNEARPSTRAGVKSPGDSAQGSFVSACLTLAEGESPMSH